MSKANHHKRKDYEQQYLRLYKEVHGHENESVSTTVFMLSDFNLLNRISHFCVQLGCVPFTDEELEMELV